MLQSRRVDVVARAGTVPWASEIQGQISLIQTGTPIKSWVYLQDPSDGSFVRNLAFTRLLVRGQCVSELSQWPGFQVVGSASMSFSCWP